MMNLVASSADRACFHSVASSWLGGLKSSMHYLLLFVLVFFGLLSRSPELFLSYFHKWMDTSDDKTFQPVQVPYDESGYCQSFYSSDPKLVDFFWKFGFVVIREAITQEQIQGTSPNRRWLTWTTDSIDHIWGLMEKLGASRKPEDWLKTRWVNVFESNYNVKRGFLGFDPAVAAGNFTLFPLESHLYQLACITFRVHLFMKHSPKFLIRRICGPNWIAME